MISNRLKLICSLADATETLVDVGTDHGYVIIELLKQGKIKFGIASDINKGPVERARANVKDNCLSQKVDFRLGPGLETIKKGEAQGAVIAGMGGNLIRDIIEDRREVFEALDYAIVQPVQNPEVLRKYILNTGIEILDEAVIYDEGKYYEIMKIKSSNNPMMKVFKEELEYEISDVLVARKDVEYKKYLEFKLNGYNNVLSRLSGDTDNVKFRKQELEKKIIRLLQLIKSF